MVKRKFIKTKLLMLSVVMAGAILVGCGREVKSGGGVSDESMDSKEAGVDEETYEEESEGESEEESEEESENLDKTFPENLTDKEPVIDINKENYCVLIGNSLLGEGKVHNHFQTIATNSGKDLKCDGEYFYGQTLSSAKLYMDNVEGYDYILDEVNEADILIFQEYGGEYGTTLEDIKEIIGDGGKENAKYFYYTTLFDDYEGGEYLKEIEEEGIHVLMTGKFLSELTTEFFRKDYGEVLRKSDGHPNSFSGYCTSLFMYSKIYKVPAKDIALETMGEEFYELLPGENDEEKCGNYEVIVELIDEIQE